MKLICFNIDDCAFVLKNITEDQKEEYSLNPDQPFIKCPECNSLAIYTNDDFVLTLDKISTLKILSKLSKKKAT